MSAIRLYLGFTLIAMIGIPASVQAEDDYGRSGFYLGVGLGLGWERFEDTGGFSDFYNGIGLDGWAGYRFDPHFAAELQLEYLDRFNTSFMGVNIDTDVLAFTGNLKAYPMTGRVQPFAVVGMGFLRAEGISASNTDFAARFGGGVDFYDSPNVSLGATVSYVLNARRQHRRSRPGTGGVDGLDYVSLVLGFQYRF